MSGMMTEKPCQEDVEGLEELCIFCFSCLGSDSIYYIYLHIYLFWFGTGEALIEGPEWGKFPMQCDIVERSTHKK